MKLKEKIKQCFQILFKGRDLEKEYEAKRKEVEELKEKVRAQLELLINSAEPAYMTDANSDRNALSVPIYKVRVAPYEGCFGHDHRETLDVMYFNLQQVNDSYRLFCNEWELSSKIDHLYERAAHEFAKVLIQKKLLRVTPVRHSLDRCDVTLVFEAMFYEGGRR